ncbi:MAG: hypothetical protein PQJ60_13120 [Spirochaetales bacterium]|nr:hypothetical protein [Spirochaetales bacterium]
MEALILLMVLFFFGIGFVFEIIGFLFRLLFSGLGVLITVVVAAGGALVAVPLVLGMIGYALPKGVVILGIIFLVVWASRRGCRWSGRDYGYRGRSRY